MTSTNESCTEYWPLLNLLLHCFQVPVFWQRHKHFSVHFLQTRHHFIYFYHICSYLPFPNPTAHSPRCCERVSPPADLLPASLPLYKFEWFFLIYSSLADSRFTWFQKKWHLTQITDGARWLPARNNARKARATMGVGGKSIFLSSTTA